MGRISPSPSTTTSTCSAPPFASNPPRPNSSLLPLTLKQHAPSRNDLLQHKSFQTTHNSNKTNFIHKTTTTQHQNPPCRSPRSRWSTSRSPGSASRPSRRYVSHRLILTLGSVADKIKDRLQQVQRGGRPRLRQLSPRTHARHEEEAQGGVRCARWFEVRCLFQSLFHSQ